MLCLSEHAIVDKITQRELFSATIAGGAFTLKITKYLPVLSTAIHNGSKLRSELISNCLLSKEQRYYEEDPHTGSFIAEQAITLVAHDSRYEYDLNRHSDACVYDTAWGVDVWQQPLSNEAIAKSKAKHGQFYRIVAAIVAALLEDFGECIVYDNHSYNYKRHQLPNLPVFNLGTSTVKSEQWRPVIDAWLAILQAMSVTGVTVRAAENEMFFGKGYLAAFCHDNYDGVLVLATETKKVFMDELTGQADQVVLPALQQAYRNSFAMHTQSYLEVFHGL